MTNDIQKGKIYSFWELLQSQNIEIPIIQRDYAQGRKDEEELRIKFLKALRDSLDKQRPIRLDFIYGSNLDDTFQPLDGQQRLTTLFLLHWYAAAKEGKLSPYIQRILTKFSYETRATSREFCDSLVKEPLNINWYSSEISPSIIDSSWFFLSWKKDPTIDAMLRTIDDVHRLFQPIDGLWEKISSDIISFYYVELENFGLTDDLYIKMNARGKLLTPFENFKAIFQGHIDKKGWETNKSFSESFAFRIDAQWCDLFWSHRKMNRIDDSFMRFISTIAMIRMALEKSPDRISQITRLQGEPNSVRANQFTEEGYQYLYDCFEIYYQLYKNKPSLPINLTLWQHKPDTDIFSALVYEGNNASYTQKVLFYAQTEYLRTVEGFDEEKFHCWMRVVRNIVARGDVTRTGQRPAIIRSPESFDGVISLIQELTQGCNNIYEFLSANSIKSSFANEQMREERLKASLITTDDAYKEVLFSTEDTNFFQGRIEFALYCIDYEETKCNFNPDKLNQIQSVIKQYLEEDVTNDFRRGLLTIPDDNGFYNYYTYWWSWSNVVSADKRCLIAKYRELEYFIYGSYKARDYKTKEYYRHYLKKLLLQLTDKSLQEVIDDFNPPAEMPNWKKRLIKEPELLDEKCKSHYIAIPEDEQCCYLLRGMRPRDLVDCEKIE